MKFQQGINTSFKSDSPFQLIDDLIGYFFYERHDVLGNQELRQDPQFQEAQLSDEAFAAAAAEVDPNDPEFWKRASSELMKRGLRDRALEVASEGRKISKDRLERQKLEEGINLTAAKAKEQRLKTEALGDADLRMQREAADFSLKLSKAEREDELSRFNAETQRMFAENARAKLKEGRAEAKAKGIVITEPTGEERKKATEVVEAANLNLDDSGRKAMVEFVSQRAKQIAKVNKGVLPSQARALALQEAQQLSTFEEGEAPASIFGIDVPFTGEEGTFAVPGATPGIAPGQAGATRQVEVPGVGAVTVRRK